MFYKDSHWVGTGTQVPYYTDRYRFFSNKQEINRSRVTGSFRYRYRTGLDVSSYRQHNALPFNTATYKTVSGKNCEGFN
jgi:hypothetical protein